MPKFLIIDDQKNIRTIIRANLTESGYEVIEADNGEDGIKLAVEEKPDLIVLDIKMPGISGWDVMQTLKKTPQLRAIPVIVMTAFITEVEEARANEAGASGFLGKPFDVDELLTKVGEALGR